MRHGVSRAGAFFCLLMVVFAVRADDWPQWMGPNRDGVWAETGIVKKLSSNDLAARTKWRVPIDGGYTGPAVVGNRVFIADYVTDGDRSPAPDKRNALKGKERVLCLDAESGKIVWSVDYDCPYGISYPAGPRCTPTVVDNKVYFLGAEGNFLCLDAATGKSIWQKDFKVEYKAPTPIWGFSGHPLVDGDTVYCLVGGEGSIVVAFDRNTGAEKWKALSAKETGYCPPTMMEAGGTKQLIVWHAQAINSLNPATGKVYWSFPLEPLYGMSIMAPRLSGPYLYAGGIGKKSILLKLAEDKPTADVVWENGDEKAIWCVCSTPVVDGGTMYGSCQQGQYRAVDMATGKRLWETFKPTTGNKRANSGTAFTVKNNDHYFIFSETGDLIIAKLSPEEKDGYTEISRAKILEATGDAFGRSVVWSHPAFANKCIYARNDKEIICINLAE